MATEKEIKGDRKMRRYLMASCFAMVASILLSPAALKADSFTFSFSTISGNGITASGTFTTNPGVNGQYLVTSITGTLNGAPMTLLAAGSWEENDNLLIFQTGATEVNGNGISFVANGVDYNLYYRPVLSSYILNVGPGPTSVTGQAVTFDPVKASEPGSILLLATGLVGVVFVYRRKLQLG